MTNWEQFKQKLTPTEYEDLAAFDDCAICPARFFCTDDRNDPDYGAYCVDVFDKWINMEYIPVEEFDDEESV